MKLETIRALIMEDARKRIKVAEEDYNRGVKDCKIGQYDKWYRYHRDDDGSAYDAGWEETNKRIKNDEIKFIEINII